MIKAKHLIKKKRMTRLRKSIAKKIKGTSERPRLVVFRSNRYLYTQVVDDDKGQVLAAASTLEKEVREKIKNLKDKEAARLIGEMIAERLQGKEIKTVVFDRNRYAYGGRIKVLADAAREKGLQF